MTTVPRLDAVPRRTTDVSGSLIRVADRSDSEIGTLVDRIGFETVAHSVVDELVYRARLDELGPVYGVGASVRLCLVSGPRSLETTISVRQGHVSIDEAAASGLPCTRITQDLVEVVRSVYGAIDRVTAASRRIQWPDPDPRVPSRERYALDKVCYLLPHRVLRALHRRDPADLAELAIICGTDKWSALHQYPLHYERHFARFRDRPLTLLEIGVGGYDNPDAGGESLRMWKHYFPRGVIHGLDLTDKHQLDQPRITTVQADQSDPVGLTRFATEAGPFDIIIDDGSHRSPHVITSFRTLFPHLRADGVYVIEDLHACYQPLFGGDDHDLNDPDMTVGFLKTLLDGLHHEEFDNPAARPPAPTDPLISGLHVYHNLAFIDRGANVEGTALHYLLPA